MAVSFVGASVQSLSFSGLNTFQVRNAVTISFWFNQRIALNGGYQDLFDFSAGGETRASVFVFDTLPAGGASTGVYATKDSDTGAAYFVGPGIGVGEWLHFAVLLGFTTQYAGYYINGTLASSRVADTWTSPSSNETCNMRLGSDGNGFNNATAYYQDVRTYTRLLSVNEIKTIYTARGADRIRDGLLNRWILNNGATGATIGASAVRDYGPAASSPGSGVNNPVWVGGLETRPAASK